MIAVKYSYAQHKWSCDSRPQFPAFLFFYSSQNITVNMLSTLQESRQNIVTWAYHLNSRSFSYVNKHFWLNQDLHSLTAAGTQIITWKKNITAQQKGDGASKAWAISFPAEPFTVSKPLSPSVDVSELYIICRLPGLNALNLWKRSVGSWAADCWLLHGVSWKWFLFVCFSFVQTDNLDSSGSI